MFPQREAKALQYARDISERVVEISRSADICKLDHRLPRQHGPPY